jgi:hypothetical protein
MSDDRDIFYAACGFFFGIWGFFWGFKRLRRKRLIENIPTSTIRGLALGLVELCGKAEKLTLLKSPLTNTECVLFKYLVEEYRRRGKNSAWVTIAAGDSFYVPFWINDATARIMVFARGAEVILPIDYKFTTGIGKKIPDFLLEFMDNHGIAYRGWLGKRTLRFREWFILPGDNVYVLGSAKKAEVYLKDRDSELIRRLEKLKEDAQKMKEADLNKDGQVSMEEWDAAVAKVEQELLQEEIKNAGAEDPLDVVMGKGDTESVFIISDHSEKDLIKKLSGECILGIFGGAALSLVLLGYLLVRLGIFKF